MRKKRILAKIIVFCALFFMILNFNLLPYVWVNGGEGGYSEGDGESFVYGSSIKYYIIKGGGYYLGGYSDILKFLDRIEVSGLNGLDYTELNQILDSAIHKMNNVNNSYFMLILIAEFTPYNLTFIDKLKTFDYRGFESAHHLNAVIFGKVEEYLKKGDITGAFKACRTDILEIIAVLEEIKGYTITNRMPDLTMLWSLNELCSESLLFGQYAARVFAEVKDS